MQDIWATDAPMRQRQEEFIAYLRGRDFDPGRLGSFAHLAFNMHGHVDPREWADIMPQILHVHAKFYDIDEHGQEPAIDYPELVRVFVEGGYRGYWSSEWEGHAFAELGEVDPLLLVRRQHDLIRRACGRCGSRHERRPSSEEEAPCTLTYPWRNSAPRTGPWSRRSSHRISTIPRSASRCGIPTG